MDEPRPTVEDVDKLVAAVTQRLAEGFANERSGLEKQWDRGDNVSNGGPSGCPAALSFLF